MYRREKTTYVEYKVFFFVADETLFKKETTLYGYRDALIDQRPYKWHWKLANN